MKEDPLGFGAGDSNLDRYVGNGPTNGTDPSGLEEDPYLKYKDQADANSSGPEASQAELDRRKEFSDKWLAKADQLMADRERDIFSRFFGSSATHDPATERELKLRRNAARVMDTKNWIVDDLGDLHSVAEIAAQGILEKLGMAKRGYNGPTISAESPAQRDAAQRRVEQNQKDLEFQQDYAATILRLRGQINPTYTYTEAEGRTMEGARQREAARAEQRWLSLSVGERIQLNLLEIVINLSAQEGLGAALGLIKLGGAAASAERLGVTSAEELKYLGNNPESLQNALAKGLESEVGRPLSTIEKAEIKTASDSLLPKVTEELKTSGDRNYIFRGDNNYRGGPLGRSLGAEADAADIQSFADHVLRKESNMSSRFSSFTTETKVAGKFASDFRYVTKAEMEVLRDLEAKGIIKIHTPDSVYETMKAGPRKISKEASAVRDAMIRNGEILIEGQIPEGVLKRLK
jgi:hypothetical protein